ncbi:MAG: ribonuclease III [Candidatus Nanopelagicales bacterium]|nr:ribonuclease III [Candidatus Nanopelagicales bacterium]
MSDLRYVQEASSPERVIGVGVQPGSNTSELCDRLGVSIAPEVLNEALTHRSYAYERGGLRPNERLEFLGDAVLSIVVTDALFRRNPEAPEGRLAKMRSALVNAKALACLAESLQLGEFILLGKGESATGGAAKTSILADTMEAVMGAVYIDQGLEVAAAMIRRLVDPMMEETEALGAALDWKTSLQELAARLGLGAPEYVLRAEGPDHDKVFSAQVQLADGLHGHGEGRTKKDAEQQAARLTFSELSGAGTSGDGD